MAIKPDCQEKAYQEIKEAVEENNGDPDLDYSAIQKLEYLEQCIHESNRAYPIGRKSSVAITVFGIFAVSR